MTEKIYSMMMHFERLETAWSVITSQLTSKHVEQSCITRVISPGTDLMLMQIYVPFPKALIITW